MVNRILLVGRWRRGLTVLELLIMSAIGIMLLGMFWSFFTQSHSDTQQMSQKLKSFQGGYLLIERIESDLRQLLFSKGTYPVTVSDEGRMLTFYRTDLKRTQPDSVYLTKMVYRYDAASREVFLNDKRILSTRFLDVRFRLDERDLKATPPREGNVMRITVKGVSAELAKKDASDIPENKTATLVTAVSLQSKTLAEQHEYWWTHTSIRPKD